MTKRINTLYHNKLDSRFISRFPQALNCMQEDISVDEAKALVDVYLDIYQHYCTRNGETWTLRRLKAYYGVCQRFAVSHHSDAVPFCKTDSDGLPIKVRLFKSFLKGTISQRRSALCILQLFKVRVGHCIDYELKHIISPGPTTGLYNCPSLGDTFRLIGKSKGFDVKTTELLVNCWTQVVKETFPDSRNKSRIRRIKRDNSLHMSGKNGPNGPCLSTAVCDYIAIAEDEHILDNVKSLAQATNNLQLLTVLEKFENDDSIESLKTKGPFYHSKLSLKQEVGGKVRVFAIGDYFTQSSLNGLHRYLFRWLIDQPEDGTFDQDRCSESVKLWTSGKMGRVNSTDLTAATDRIPVMLQCEIVSQISNENIARNWINLISNRDFIGPSGESIRYAVGQPMGFKTSWAMLAVWHHMVYRTALKLIGTKYDPTNSQYKVVGDDSCCIGNVAEAYQLIVEGYCNVPISPLKGFSDTSYDEELNPITGGVAAEFAKRVFVNDVEVTPVSPILIKEGLEYPTGLKQLLVDMNRRNYTLSCPNPGVGTLASLGFKPYASLSESSFPLWGAPQFEGNSLLKDRSFAEIGKECPWDNIPEDVLAYSTGDCLKGKIQEALDKSSTRLKDLSSGLVDESILCCAKYQFTSKAHLFLTQSVYNEIRSKIIGSFFDFGSSESTKSTGRIAISELKSSASKLISVYDIDQLTGVLKDKRLKRSKRYNTLLTEVSKLVLDRINSNWKPVESNATNDEVIFIDDDDDIMVLEAGAPISLI